jgi:hypothetical protein
MPLTQSEASLFIALPDTPWQFVCAGAEDITLPGGDLTTVFTLSPDYGSWAPSRIVRGAPGNMTTTMRLRLETTRDQWLRLSCGPIAMRVNFSTTGERANPTNFSSAIVLTGGEMGDKTITAPVSLEPTTNVIEATVALAFTGYVLWSPPAERQIATLSDVVMAGAESESCGTVCTPPVGYLQRLYAVSSDGTDHAFHFSVNGGASWTNTALNFVPTFVTRVGQRYLVGGSGGTDAPAVIASSTNGVTFTVTNLPSANGASVVGVCRTNDGAVYAATTDGTIHRSANGGLAWEAVGSFTALSAITTDGRMVYAVGSGGRVVYGSGTQFASITLGSQSFVAASVNWSRRLVIATATSIYTWAPGLTATEVGAIGTGITSMQLSSDGVFGMAVGNGVHVTEDGGLTWYTLSDATRQRVTVTSGPAWVLTGSDAVYVVEPVERVC